MFTLKVTYKYMTPSLMPRENNKIIMKEEYMTKNSFRYKLVNNTLKIKKDNNNE